MRRWYIAFSGAAYDEPTSRIVENARAIGGADELRIYDDVWLTQHEFYRTNKWIFDHPGMPLPGGGHCKRGFGWYAWKPLVILETFKLMAEGDVVLFTDADCYPIRPLDVVWDTAAKDGAMLFAAIWHTHQHWCKADCFVAMGQPADHGRVQQAGVARYCAFQKGPWKPYQFLMEWLTYAVNPVATTFDESFCAKERADFQEHRTEQAIMTCLAHKHGYKLWREACQYGNPHPQDREVFGQLFETLDSTKMGAPAEGSRWRNV